MKILIAPLNWGLGHASRCIPIIRQYLASGDEVVLGGDGDSLALLCQHFPQLRVLHLASLHLRYSSRNSQVGAMLCAMPHLVRFTVQDHRMLRRILATERFDLVISDNRFGLFRRDTHCVYITHQLHILLPRFWRWLQPLATLAHACIYNRYDEIWIPDTEQDGLAGRLSHPAVTNSRYIGVLSRLIKSDEVCTDYDVVAVLSGLEPQRTILEQYIVHRYHQSLEQVLIVRGKVLESATCTHSGNIHFVNHLPDTDLVAYLQGAKRIIARSGYSTIMDLQKLGLLSKTEFHATPGQPEQEYLATLFSSR